MSDTTRLAELRERKAKLDAARDAAKEKREVEELELELRFTDELGARGSTFEIIDSGELGEGFIVVKLGEEIAWKKFTSSKMGTAETYDLVRPLVVHPSLEDFDNIARRRGALVVRAGNAIATLYGVKLEGSTGK